MIILFFRNNLELIFFHITYTPECDPKLIFLRKLEETGILYQDNLKCIVLK